MDEFQRILDQSLRKGTFVSLVLSKPATARGPDRASRVTVRPVEVRGKRRWQWTRQVSRQQTHENLDERQSVARAAELLGAEFQHAHLFSTESDVFARVDRSGRCRIKTGPPSKDQQADPQHDRQKSYLIPEGRPCPFLQQLGVMTAEGRVHSSRRDKFRQINRFLEFVEDVVPHLPATGRLEVIDFGCGLSYLTFALHHLLTAVHRRDVHIVGIDHNSQVIQRCIQTGSSLGYKDMEFKTEPIPTSLQPGKIHLAVALHACDTATDDALAQAVCGQADVILAAPCCQHELATQLNGTALDLLTRHGILKERLASLTTDALRAAILENAGYRTQIIEFIDTEHTPKNLLIRAVRRSAGSPDPKLPDRIAELKTLLGIDQMRLEDLLDNADFAMD